MFIFSIEWLYNNLFTLLKSLWLDKSFFEFIKWRKILSTTFKKNAHKNKQKTIISAAIWKSNIFRSSVAARARCVKPITNVIIIYFIFFILYSAVKSIYSSILGLEFQTIAFSRIRISYYNYRLIIFGLKVYSDANFYTWFAPCQYCRDVNYKLYIKRQK